MGSIVGHSISQETKDKIRATLSGHTVSQETRDKISKSKTGKPYNRQNYSHSQETKEKLRVARTGKKLSEETKLKIRESMKKTWENPDDRTRRTESLKQIWEDPEYRQRMSDIQLGHAVSEETKQKISRGHIGKPQSEEHRKKVTLYNKTRAEKHPEHIQKGLESNIGGFWYGNVRYYDGPQYCNKFNDSFRARVREFRGRVCFQCGAPENGQRLHVHHVHYDKKMCCNGSPKDVVPLCVACHTKTNFNRDYWENHFVEKIYSLDPNGKCFFTKEEIAELNKIVI